MNEAARGHLDSAAGHIAHGDEYYRKAGTEIVAARREGATWNEIADHLGYSDEWCRQVAEMPANRTKPDWRRGSHGTTAEITKGAARLLREAPLEEVEHLIEDLPTERVAKIARAALQRPGVPREMAHDPESSSTMLKAGVEHTAEMEATGERQRREQRGGGKRGGMDVLVNVIGKARKAYLSLEESYQAAHESELTDDQKEVLFDYLSKTSQLAAWFREYVETGSASDELDQLLS